MNAPLFRAVLVAMGLAAAEVFAAGGERPIDFKAHIQAWWGGGWNQTEDVGGAGINFDETDAAGGDFALSEGSGAVAITVGPIRQEGDDSSGGASFKRKTEGWLMGLRHHSPFAAGKFSIGAGAAFLDNELTMAGVKSTEDQVLLLGWSGLCTVFGSGLTMGVDFKWFDADTEVGGVDLDLEGDAAGFSIGFLLD